MTNDKLSRFRMASAARRREKEGQKSSFQPRRLADAEIDYARRTSPEAFLRRYHPDLEANRPGTSLSVPKVLRADQRPDGLWLACDWEAKPIGDNISLVRYVLPDLSFPDAVLELTGAVATSRIEVPSLPPAAVVYPRLPPVSCEERGRDYLRGRGISLDTIHASEQAGLVRYADSGVLFLGRDLASPSRSVRSATIRYYEPVLWNGQHLNKRDLANSDKASFPAVLPGDPDSVAVVEGGVSGLAVRDIALRQGQPAPTVIITGGVGTRRWVTRNAFIREVLVSAHSVAIWAEHEATSKTQVDAEALRERLLLAIAEERQGEIPPIVYPPDGFKDAASWNFAQASGHHGDCGMNPR